MGVVGKSCWRCRWTDIRALALTDLSVPIALESGGRKPIHDVAKSEAFTTRIQPKTRQALEEAGASNQSISRMAEILLEAGLRKPPGEPHNRSLGVAVAALAEDIERESGRSWRQDAFAAQALRNGIETILLQSAKQGPVTVPPALEREAAKMPAELGLRFRNAVGFGQTAGYDFVQKLKRAPTPETLFKINWELLVDEAHQLGFIARDLGLTASKKGKSK
jgi:hypothetical protein